MRRVWLVLLARTGGSGACKIAVRALCLKSLPRPCLLVHMANEFGISALEWSGMQFIKQSTDPQANLSKSALQKGRSVVKREQALWRACHTHHGSCDSMGLCHTLSCICRKDHSCIRQRSNCPDKGSHRQNTWVCFLTMR